MQSLRRSIGRKAGFTTATDSTWRLLHALLARVTTLQAVRKSAASLMVIRSITGNYYKKQAPEHGKTRLASHAACCERHVHWSISQRIAQFRVKKEGAQIKKPPGWTHPTHEEWRFVSDKLMLVHKKQVKGPIEPPCGAIRFCCIIRDHL